MKQLNSEQLQQFILLLEHHRTYEVESLLIEKIGLLPIAAKNLVRLLDESPEALKIFKENPQILESEQLSNIKTESQSFNFNFHSSKVKITNQDGKTIEITDRDPEWQNLKKQFNIDLTEPEALSNFVETFKQTHFQQTTSNSTRLDCSEVDSTPYNHSNFSNTQASDNQRHHNAGVEDLSQNNKSKSRLLSLLILVVIASAIFYFMKS